MSSNDSRLFASMAQVNVVFLLPECLSQMRHNPITSELDATFTHLIALVSVAVKMSKGLPKI